MKFADVEDNIGKICTLNGYGDLMMEKSKYGRFIRTPEELEWPLFIVKLTKAGLVQLSYDSPDEHVDISVPVKNVDLITMSIVDDDIKYQYKDR